MKPEDKHLLLVDLSERLPYGVKLKHIPTNEITTLEFIGKFTIDGDIHDVIENFSVCLFPLSSMTEEQIKEFNSITQKCSTYIGKSILLTDFCNKHLFGA